MKTQSFAWELRTLIAQFVDAFNDIVIRRYNENKVEADQIHVNFVYAPKTRTLHDLVNKAQHIKLPVISVWVTGIERDQSRVFNKLEGPFYNQGINSNGFTHPLQPVPVNITINMAIMTRFQQDLDQIIGNWGCWTDPYIVVSWIEPHTGLEIRSPIHWSGNISLEYPLDINNTQPYRQIANTSFKIEGWLYKDVAEPVGKIYKIDTSFTAASGIFMNFDTMQRFESDVSTDYFTISGRPTVTMCEPHLMIPCVEGKIFTIQGSMFDHLCALFVSGGPGVFVDAPISIPLSAGAGIYSYYYNPLSGSPTLSAKYPGFSGVQVSNYTVHAPSQITFIMPSAVSAGFIDIIPLTEAGYGKITIDAWRPTLNPYPSGTTEYNNYVGYQHPSVSGIEVAPFYYYCT